MNVGVVRRLTQCDRTGLQRRFDNRVACGINRRSGTIPRPQRPAGKKLSQIPPDCIAALAAQVEESGHLRHRVDEGPKPPTILPGNRVVLVEWSEYGQDD